MEAGKGQSNNFSGTFQSNNMVLILKLVSMTTEKPQSAERYGQVLLQTQNKLINNNEKTNF